MATRNKLGLDTPTGAAVEPETIDLEELTGAAPTAPRLTAAQVEQIGRETGFVNRDPVPETAPKPKKKQPTPYIIQRNFKFRAGMPELLSAVSKRLGLKSQMVIEQAILALIEKEERLDSFKPRIERILKNDRDR